MEYNQSVVEDLWTILSSADHLMMNEEPSMIIDTSQLKLQYTPDMSPALSPTSTVPPSPAISSTSEYSNKDYQNPVQTSQMALHELNWISECIMNDPDFPVAALGSSIQNSLGTSVPTMPTSVPVGSCITPTTVTQSTNYQKDPVQPTPSAPVPQPVCKLPVPQPPAPQPIKVKQEPISPKPFTGGRPRQKGSSKIVTGNKTELDEMDLTCLPVRELNKRLQGCARDEIMKIKQKRRTLKNRGYAQNCRTKRMVQRSELEDENQTLMTNLETVHNDLRVLQNELHKVMAQRDMYRNQWDNLRRRHVLESTQPSSPCSITFT